VSSVIHCHQQAATAGKVLADGIVESALIMTKPLLQDNRDSASFHHYYGVDARAWMI
jgi:hypothetical protein